jgi:thioredoxin 1
MSVGTVLTEATFDEIVGASDVPVLVDFWASWCHPCRIFDPVLVALADADRRFRLASVDIDANPGLAVRFGVMSAPTLLLVDGPSILWRTVGARSRSRLADELEPVLTAATSGALG